MVAFERLTEMNYRRLGKALLAVVLGLCIALSIGSLVVSTDTPWVVIGLVLVSFSLLGTALAFVLLRKVIFPGLRRYSWKVCLIWIGLCLLAGYFFVYWIPWTSFPKVNHLRIIATGEKNILAKGQEVWLAGITTGQRDYTSNLDHICQGNWAITDGMLVSSQLTPNILDCQIHTDDFIKVKFGMHPWSGKLSILFGGQNVIQDLFSSTGATYEKEFQVTLTEYERILQALLLTANGITLALLLLTLTVWAINRPQQNQAISRTAIPWYIYASPLITVWSIYLIIYWPGFFSPDTVAQFNMFVNHAISDWHPAFHTLTLWFLTRLWFSPAVVNIVQILLLGILLGWGFSLVDEYGTPRWAIYLGVIFLAFSPGVALILLNPWKDVAYSICMVALAIFIFLTVQSAGAWLKNTSSWIAIALIVSLVSLYRHNGAPVAFGSLLLLLVAYPKMWKPLLWATLLGLAMIWFVRGPIYRLVGVNSGNISQGNNLGVSSTALTLLNWHREAGTPLSEEVITTLNQNDALAQEGEGLRLEALAKKASSLDQQALLVSFRYPWTTAKFILNRATYIFQILKPSTARFEYAGLAMDDNPYGFKSANWFPRAGVLLNRLVFLSEKIYFDWLFWRNAFWMDLLILGAIVACVRMRNWRYFMLTVPVLLNALPLAIFSGGQISRYILPTLLVGPLFGAFLWLASPSQEVLNDAMSLKHRSLGKRMAKSSAVLKSAFSLQSNLQAFTELISLLTLHRNLTFVMARREITDRYAGQFFGVMWTFVHPLITILVYVFLFTFVYTTRSSVVPGTPADLTTYILAGIIPWLAIADVMGKSSTMILNNASLVKQVIFPIEVLPVKGVVASFFIELIFLALMLVYSLFASHTILWTSLLLPLVLFFQTLALIGLGYIFSAVGTYIRDTKDFVQIFLQIGFWFVPILYLPEQIPQIVRPILYINPFTYMIFCFQDILFFDRIAHPLAWIIFPVLSLVVFLYGYRLFRRLKVMFGNVL